MNPGLSILCVTNLAAHAQVPLICMSTLADHLGAEFVVGVDGGGEIPLDKGWFDSRVDLQSNGCIESVLDQAIAACSGEYVLRLDDDERVSEAMFTWLSEGRYHDADHWAFPRMHLWPDEEHYITSEPLWPDLQTRLSVKAKAGGRTAVHQGSPYGTGRVADVAIEHHKFLVRDLAEREALVEHYERLQPGAGSDHFARFSVPERYSDHLTTAAVRA